MPKPLSTPPDMPDMPDTPPVLVVNAGSSSLKLKLLPAGLSLAVERIGARASLGASFEVGVEDAEVARVRDHTGALELALTALGRALPGFTVAAVGHRVVHGGARYTAPTRLDAEVLRELAALSALAPLHNPPNLEGIRAAMRLLPDTPQVAVFDTAFHSTLPPRAYLYGLPRDLLAAGIRRYGFHGTSHDHVTRRAAALIGRPREALRLISLHLGNGASAAAVERGRSVDTSMGLTPLEGLLMGTRSGDLDPGVLLYLLRDGVSPRDLDTLLNKRSGLLGLSGVSNDMRDVRRAAREGHREAQEALEVFSYRLRKTIGSYAAAMAGLDAIIFTGGIGENDPDTRREALVGLEFLGVTLDEAKNARGETFIHHKQGDAEAVQVLVVPTDEEGMIAQATLERLAAPS